MCVCVCVCVCVILNKNWRPRLNTICVFSIYNMYYRPYHHIPTERIPMTLSLPFSLSLSLSLSLSRHPLLSAIAFGNFFR